MSTAIYPLHPIHLDAARQLCAHLQTLPVAALNTVFCDALGRIAVCPIAMAEEEPPLLPIWTWTAKWRNANPTQGTVELWLKPAGRRSNFIAGEAKKNYLAAVGFPPELQALLLASGIQKKYILANDIYRAWRDGLDATGLTGPDREIVSGVLTLIQQTGCGERASRFNQISQVSQACQNWLQKWTQPTPVANEAKRHVMSYH